MSQLEFPTKSYATIVEKAYAPAYFEKLARDWNIVPTTEADQSLLLELAGLIRGAREQEVEKTAGTNPFLREAADGLKGALGQAGYQTNVPSSEEKFAKEAAYHAIQDPTTLQAVLEFGDYLNKSSGASGQTGGEEKK